jgi:uncharacterized protein YdiU (UPF0061 family)
MFKWDQKKIPILQLGGDFYDEVKPAVFPKGQLRYWNDSLCILFSKQHFVQFNAIDGNLLAPLALRYHGHQFQHYNRDLGDGRGFLFAQVQQSEQWYDLGTKGSGQTPYSRAGDGRLTLKGAFRESLATEMLESLGVNTSKTLSFFETGEQLERHDEPSPTRSAVLTRYSLGHIRIGTFQRLAFFNQIENIKKLTSYCIYFYYPEIENKFSDSNDLVRTQAFLNAVIDRNAKLVAQVMMCGFVHGVLNTDNINIAGELFDYGPYRFLPNYDPQFTAAYFDQQGLYCFGRQPSTFLWNLNQLAISLKPAFPELEIEKSLEKFSELFNFYIQRFFLKRLNLKSKTTEENAKLLSTYFQMLSQTEVHFEKAFFDFHSKRALHTTQISIYEKHGAEFIKLLDTYEVSDPNLITHPYFKNENPSTLLIEEIESLWKPIAENDDWSSYDTKLQSIRQFRGVF